MTHPNIVSCIESFTEGSSFYIVMEYAAAGDLQKLINRFGSEGRFISFGVFYLAFLPSAQFVPSCLTVSMHWDVFMTMELFTEILNRLIFCFSVTEP